MTDKPYDREVFDRAMIALAASAAVTACGADYDVPLYDAEMELMPELLSEGGAFVIPMLIPEEVESGDSRIFEKESLSHRDLPLPLLWQIQTADGHDGSVVVGRIDHVERIDGGLGNAYGVFDTGPYGAEAERLVRGKFLRGVSADLDKFEANVKDEPVDELAEDGDSDADDIKDKIKSDKITVTKGRVMAATLVPKPAFQECTIAMADQSEITDADLLEDGIYEEETEDPDAVLAALAASAAPVTPPKDWFTNPKLAAPTPITVDDDGRVFGHIATWKTQHIGLARPTPPPRSPSNYAYFRTGVLRTHEGDDVAVGQLTLAGGHAPMPADAAAAVKHYDDTASAVADVAAGEDAHGIWVAGALRPSVSPEQVRVLRASAPSGDWRPINGKLELVAVCQVNVPGFPVARTMVAGGQVTALVAAGARFMAELREEPVKQLTNRVDALEKAELAKLKANAMSRVSPLQERRRAELSAAAEAARSRLQPAKDRREAMVASAADARSRVLALKMAPSRVWDEEKHPRDMDGEFRKIIARLGDLLTGIDGADEATRKISSAAEHEDGGNSEAAKDAAREARARLTELEENIVDPSTLDRIKQAESEIDVAIGQSDAGAPSPEGRADAPDTAPAEAPIPAPQEAPTSPRAAARQESGGEGIGDVIAEQIDISAGDGPPMARFISWLMNQIVSKVDPSQAVRNAPKEFGRFLDGKEFQNNEELASYLQELIRRMVSPV